MLRLKAKFGSMPRPAIEILQTAMKENAAAIEIEIESDDRPMFLVGKFYVGHTADRPFAMEAKTLTAEGEVVLKAFAAAMLDEPSLKVLSVEKSSY